MIAAERLKFDPAAHAYSLDGQPVPSVTSVLAAEGLSGSSFWKDSDRRRGTAVHSLAHLLTRRPWRGATVQEVIDNSLWSPEATAPVLIPYGKAAAGFLLGSGFRPEITECSVASVLFRIAGTFDAVGKLPTGQTLLIDWKSGMPQNSVWLQLAIYAMCLEHTLGIKVDLMAPVWLQPSGQYKMFPPQPPGGANLSIAQCAINLFHWRSQNRML